MIADIAVAIILAAGVLLCWLCALGVVVMPTVYDKLHYVAPAGLLGSLAVLVAVILHRGLSTEAGKVFVIVVLLWLSNPVLTYATARAADTRESRRSGPESEKQP
ncbi:MAG: cation:proton antiporter [Solirubrobacterales bacterium]